MPLMRTFLKILCPLLLWQLQGCGGGGGGSSAPATDTNAITVYGDSMASGGFTDGSRLDPTPAQVLARLTGRTVVDQSAPGTETADALQGLPPAPFPPFAQQIAADPSPTVLLRYGAADAVLGVATEATERNMAELVRLARAQRKRVWVVGVPFVSPGNTHATVAAVDAADAALRRVAQAAGVPFIDLRAVQFFGDVDLADPIHPGRAYSDRLSLAIANALR